MARLTQTQIDMIRALRKENVSYKQISIRMDISINTVKAYCRRHIPKSEMPDVVTNTKKQKHRQHKPRKTTVQVDPVCEVTISYTPYDTEALPFLLDTLSSVFTGR